MANWCVQKVGDLALPYSRINLEMSLIDFMEISFQVFQDCLGISVVQLIADDLAPAHTIFPSFQEVTYGKKEKAVQRKITDFLFLLIIHS